MISTRPSRSFRDSRLSRLAGEGRRRAGLLAVLALVACAPSDPEVARWEAMADAIEITRDEWGIAHIYGPTDAHAVFGAMYAQAEDEKKYRWAPAR